MKSSYEEVEYLIDTGASEELIDAKASQISNTLFEVKEKIKALNISKKIASSGFFITLTAVMGELGYLIYDLIQYSLTGEKHFFIHATICNIAITAAAFRYVSVTRKNNENMEELNNLTFVEKDLEEAQGLIRSYCKNKTHELSRENNYSGPSQSCKIKSPNIVMPYQSLDDIPVYNKKVSEDKPLTRARKPR